MKKVTCVERINQVVFVVVLEYRNSCTKTAAKLAEPTTSYNEMRSFVKEKITFKKVSLKFFVLYQEIHR